MSRSNVAKLTLLTKTLERRKAKIERRIDNLKREYVDTLNMLNKLDEQVLAMLQPQVEQIKKELIDIPVVPEDINLQREVL